MTTKGRRQTDVDRVLLSLGELPRPRPRPTLVIIAGLPGVGKSYFSRELSLQAGAAVLESDAIRRLLFERPSYSWAESRRVFNALHSAADCLLDAGISCIVDATNVAEIYRQPLYDIAERRKTKLVIVEVTAPAEVAIARLSAEAAGERLSEADSVIYERMRRAWEDICRDHFTVDGTKPVRSGIEAVKGAMEDP